MSDFRLSRRDALAAAAGLLTAASAPAWAAAPSPFTLGVASGDPTPDGFVIWTRLAPDPLAADGAGGLKGPVPVRWEVAEDEAMRRVVASGTARADDGFAHSAHVEVAGLRSNRPYWYRFRALGEVSPIGRARTAPAPGQAVDRLRFAFASCAHYERGFFSAYRHMASEQPDLVMFLGDYIYESSYPDVPEMVVRRHAVREAKDLASYRLRYAQYRTDPDLQALHAAAPCLMTWDDHEVQNDYANRWSENLDVDPAAFLKRRAAAYRAYYEHMPLRARSRPNGPDMRVYDRLAFGDLMQVFVLDGRQYRTIQPCALPDTRHGHVAAASCAERTDPSRTMLGFEQERWLYDGFRTSRARWNVVAQDLLIASLLQKDPKTGLVGHYTDGWDGYPATRTRMLKAVADSRMRNPVFLGGDIHSFWVTDLKADFDDPASPTVATEFVGTSVTSDGPDEQLFASMLPQNSHVKFFEARYRGYVAADLTPGRMETRLQVVSDRRDPRASVSTLKRWVVEDGRPGAVEA
jgi:alkaline phosphatase D